MIKPEDLRIGNLVFHDGDINEIKGVFTEFTMRKDSEGRYHETMYMVQLKNLLDYTSEEINAIPLTEEWLFKFGAKELKAKRGILKEYVLKTVRIEFSNSHNFYYKNSKVIISSVHQLQNLFFALTGKELEVKGE